MSSSNCCFLICIWVSQEAGQVVWYSHLFQNFPQFFVVHTVKGFGVVNKAEVGVFLELSCFFNDPAVVGILISGSSAFLKTSLSIWKFTRLLFKKQTNKQKKKTDWVTQIAEFYFLEVCRLVSPRSRLQQVQSPVRAHSLVYVFSLCLHMAEGASGPLKPVIRSLTPFMTAWFSWYNLSPKGHTSKYNHIGD